jgi:hypothetical protein
MVSSIFLSVSVLIRAVTAVSGLVSGVILCFICRHPGCLCRHPGCLCHDPGSSFCHLVVAVIIQEASAVFQVVSANIQVVPANIQVVLAIIWDVAAVGLSECRMEAAKLGSV